MFRPGQHVLCLAATAGWAKTFPAIRFPTTGHVYTVRAVVYGGSISSENDIEGLYLDEIRNAPLSGDEVEPAFAAHGFRPVSLTALEVFRRVVAPKREHA